jgi:rod shape-determining protein MreD
MTAVRKGMRALAIPLALVLAVTGQLAVVNRAPLPGGGAPDLVLLVVTALAVTTGPMIGTLAGFAGGLALDVAPPGGHLAGEYALVFCLVGYACGRVSAAVEDVSGERSPLPWLTLMALGAAAGEAGKAALGMMLSDPSVTGPAVKHVLPGAILYDLLLCPFVLWLVWVAVRPPAPERAPQPQFGQAQRLAAAFRLASAGAAPKLRLAGSTPLLVPPPVRSEPKLRLAGSRSPSLSGTNAAFSPGRPAVAGGRAVKLNFGSSGRGNSLGGASTLRTPQSWQGQRWPGKAPAKGWLRPDRPARTTPRRSSPGKGWLRPDRPAGTARRPKSPAKGWLHPDRLAPAPRRSSPGKGWLRPDRPAGATRRPKSPGKGWLHPDRPAPVPRRKSPGKGWLRPDKPAPVPRRKSPGKGWLRPDKPAPVPRRKSPGKGWLRPARPARSNWYTRSPSGRWLRRSRNPWRSRRQRLLQLVGGRR